MGVPTSRHLLVVNQITLDLPFFSFAYVYVRVVQYSQNWIVIFGSVVYWSQISINSAHIFVPIEMFVHTRLGLHELCVRGGYIMVFSLF